MTAIRERIKVSTHSRLKAAGIRWQMCFIMSTSFNTQPPEGGWDCYDCNQRTYQSFNTQPPEGGWNSGGNSAESRVSFNTQPPEGGWFGQYENSREDMEVSTHSRLKAAGP